MKLVMIKIKFDEMLPCLMVPRATGALRGRPLPPSRPGSSSAARQHSGNIQGTFREHSGNLQGTFREHSGNLQGIFRDHSGNIQ
jgi:hypothetical protein